MPLSRRTTTTPAVRRAAAALALLLAGGVAGALVLAPEAGWAQGVLVSANPTAGAVLTTAPAEVVLTFTAAAERDLSHVSVRDPAGESVLSGELSAAGSGELRQPIRITAAGDFTVAYHVEFRDGTEATGALRFSVGTGVAPPPVDAAAQQAETAALQQHGHEIDGLSAVLLVVDFGVLFGVFALLMLRPSPRRRSKQPDSA